MIGWSLLLVVPGLLLHLCAVTPTWYCAERLRTVRLYPSGPTCIIPSKRVGISERSDAAGLPAYSLRLTSDDRAGEGVWRRTAVARLDRRGSAAARGLPGAARHPAA